MDGQGDEVLQVEVPTELVRHVLSYFTNEPRVWLGPAAGVCRLWRAVSHELLREHATSLWSALPPPSPFPAWVEPTGAVHYLWRHVRTLRPVLDKDGDTVDWEAYQQLVVIAQAGSLPAPHEEKQPIQSEYHQWTTSESRITPKQAWSDKSWDALFKRFIIGGCHSRVFDAASGPVASFLRLLLLASSEDVMLVSVHRLGGHPFVSIDESDLKLFITLRPSAAAWLPWIDQRRLELDEGEEAEAEAGAGRAPAHLICVHLRDSTTL